MIRISLYKGNKKFEIKLKMSEECDSNMRHKGNLFLVYFSN